METIKVDMFSSYTIIVLKSYVQIDRITEALERFGVFYQVNQSKEIHYQAQNNHIVIPYLANNFNLIVK